MAGRHREERTVNRGSSPEGTGGAGTIYEYRVAALALGAMLCHVPVEGLAGPPTEIRLQQGDTGYPLDDVIAVDRSGSFEFVVEKQVKRTLKVKPSEESWRKTIRQCLASLEQYGPDVDARRRLFGVVSTGPLSDLEALAKLAKAADRPRLDDFKADLAVPRRRGEPYHRLWDHLTTTVAQLMTASDGATPTPQVVEEMAFRIARRLVVEIEPEQGGASYHALLRLLDSTLVASDRGPRAADVFLRLADIAEQFGPQGAELDVTMLRDLLHQRGVVLRGDPPALPELEAVEQWTERVLSDPRVGQRLGGRLHLERNLLTQTVLGAVRDHERVLLTGPPGVGKSALGRAVARRVRQDGASVFTLSLAEHPWKTLSDVELAVGARVERTLAAAPGGNRLLLVDGAEQVLTDAGYLLSSLLGALPRSDGGRWHVLAVVREQAADQVGEVLSESGGQQAVQRIEVPGLDDAEVRSVTAAFPALRVLQRSARPSRLLRNLYVVEQLLRQEGDDHSPEQVLGEEDVIDWVYEHVVRRRDGKRPGLGSPDERSDVYLAMADTVLNGHSQSGLRKLPGVAREGLVSDGILVRDGTEFSFTHDVQQDYAVALRLRAGDAPDVPRAPRPRRLLRGVRLWGQMLLARAARRRPAQLPAAWQELSAVARRLAEGDDVRWADVPFEAIFELGQPDAVWPALASQMLEDGGLALITAAKRRVRDAEIALPVMEFLITHAGRLGPEAAGEALAWTASWIHTMADAAPNHLVEGVPAAAVSWYDGGSLHARETAMALACAAGRLDETARNLLTDIAVRHPLAVQAIVEDQRLGKLMARLEPELLAGAARALYLGPPGSLGQFHGRDGVRDPWWPILSGIARELNPKLPDPADLGPFAVLLEYAPEHGLPLVGEIADAATAAVTRRDREDLSGESRITWPLQAGLRTYARSTTVWAWPWAGSSGPGPALAALAALRRWARSRATSGANLAGLVERVLACGESIALLAVVVDILAENAARVDSELDPALEQPAIWLLPSAPSSLVTAIPLIVMRAPCERQDAYRRLGQRLLAEHTARPLSSEAPGVEERQRTRDHIMRTMAALLDHTCYRLIELPRGGGSVLVNSAVQQIQAEDEAAQGDMRRFIERFSLPEDACRARDEAGPTDVQRLFERLALLEASHSESPPMDGPQDMDNSQASVASVIVKAATAYDNTVEPWQLRWAGEQLVTAASRTPQAATRLDDGEVVCEAKDFQAGDRSAALALPVLLENETLRRGTGLAVREVRNAVMQLASSRFIEVRTLLATNLTDRWERTGCTSAADVLHVSGLDALTEMVATAGLHPADEAGIRRSYRLPSLIEPVLTGSDPVVDLRLAAPAVGALSRAASTDCVHREQADALLEALTVHDRRTWTKQPAEMAPHIRAWRLAHDEITARQALDGNRERLDEILQAFTGQPDALIDLLLALAQQATTPAQATQLLALWPALLNSLLSLSQQSSKSLREALLPVPADGVSWPAAPVRIIIATWATAHTATPALADHLIHVLYRHRLLATADISFVLDVLGTHVSAIARNSHRAVPILRHVLTDPVLRIGPNADRAGRLLDALAASGDEQAIHAQRELENAPGLE
ncbi:ATP-binding protein [Kitasatospora sp. NPDC004669]|uniref:ATP-binding protein n=1 Tax=Kitasatospora sp. NPDC004669 TaxID=3154555 RepID=UPI0033A2187D